MIAPASSKTSSIDTSLIVICLVRVVRYIDLSLLFFMVIDGDWLSQCPVDSLGRAPVVEHGIGGCAGIPYLFDTFEEVSGQAEVDMDNKGNPPVDEFAGEYMAKGRQWCHNSL